MEAKICQSCGMPMTKEEHFGTNTDGSKSEEYCTYCYQKGAFLQDQTMDEMIESCAQFMLEENKNMTLEQAKEMMKEYMPTLKRWKTV
ncbi:MAG: zinc ribbon domain-containing protein [Clostridiales bacterium]|nr:zinc ribbon domain-containing protein [Clostridiales bacterium]